MRLGTTSYIIPADILPNAEWLAGRVDDIELVLFQVDSDGGNLPDAATVARLAELGAAHDLSYTVHLPLDLRLAADGSAASASLHAAELVFAATAPLDPLAYVLHLDATDLGDPTAWRQRARRSLELAGELCGDPTRLAVENLERWDPAHFAPLFDELPISRCVDVGHLWLEGHDPLPYLDAWLPRARVVHLHGIGERDHQSLALMPPERLRPVVERLLDFDGVVTLEVFGQEDFESSLAAWHEAASTPRR